MDDWGYPHDYENLERCVFVGSFHVLCSTGFLCIFETMTRLGLERPWWMFIKFIDPKKQWLGPDNSIFRIGYFKHQGTLTHCDLCRSDI